MGVQQLRLVGNSGSGVAVGGRPDSRLMDFGLRESNGKVIKVTGKGANQKFALVSNFTVEAIRTGTARFLHGTRTPVHVVEIRSIMSGPLSLESRGSVYAAASYGQASDGKLLVLNPRQFQTYLAHKIERRGIQRDDSSVGQVFLVGTFVNDNDRLVPNDEVKFPQGREECWYHGHTFEASGDKRVFSKVGALQTDDSIRILLTWGLGSLLKGALEWAYPHIEVTADSGVGKNTLAEILRDRFGWMYVAGPAEFGTTYRAKKAVANSVMPIQIQEAGRLSRAAVDRLVQMLNLSFNAEPTTHGAHGKTFVLTAPAMLWGQDSPVDDVALSAKMVRLSPTAENKDPKALRRLRKCSAVWPMGQWVRFLCDWANQRDVRTLATTKAAWLRRQLDRCDYTETSNTDRTISNYAALLVTAEALNAFGVSVDIKASVADLLRRHLTEWTKEHASVACQVLRDLLLEIQKPSGRGALIHDLRPEGLYFKPENALQILRGRGSRYDITSPRKLTEMLKRERLGTASVQHRVGGIQARYFLVPREKLAEFDFQYDADDSW